jgi:hypothetical protein
MHLRCVGSTHGDGPLSAGAEACGNRTESCGRSLEHTSSSRCAVDALQGWDSAPPGDGNGDGGVDGVGTWEGKVSVPV